jgi:hypothetical protein
MLIRYHRDDKQATDPCVDRRIENTMITGKGDKKATNNQLHTND